MVGCLPFRWTSFSEKTSPGTRSQVDEYVHRGAQSFDTVDARLLRNETGIEFRRKPANTHALDAENSVQAVRAASNVMVQYMHMNGSKVGSFALVHACLVLKDDDS